ncbi:MAG: HIT domain-containing protein [Dehalococcoidia bacterium]
MIHEDGQAVVFLNMTQPLYGYTLVAPRQHREHVVSDFTTEEYLSLQRLVHSVGKAIQRVVPTERMYVLSLGSQQGNRHVHWHIAPLPPGVPYSQQQMAALSHENGVLDLTEDDKASLAQRIKSELENILR